MYFWSVLIGWFEARAFPFIFFIFLLLLLLLLLLVVVVLLLLLLLCRVSPSKNQPWETLLKRNWRVSRTGMKLTLAGGESQRWVYSSSSSSSWAAFQWPGREASPPPWNNGGKWKLRRGKLRMMMEWRNEIWIFLSEKWWNEHWKRRKIIWRRRKKTKEEEKKEEEEEQQQQQQAEVKVIVGEVEKVRTKMKSPIRSQCLNNTPIIDHVTSLKKIIILLPPSSSSSESELSI